MSHNPIQQRATPSPWEEQQKWLEVRVASLDLLGTKCCAEATPDKISHNLLGVNWWHVPVVDKLLFWCLGMVEVVAGSAEKGLALLGDMVTGWDSVLLSGSVMVPLVSVKL